jgi:predicted DCC family thiol-disulfide oxidoreductase YuxK
MKTVYLLENGRFYSRSTAFLRIVRKLSFPWNLLCVLILIPRPLRDCVYNFVATNRFRWFGEKNSCRLPDEKEKERFIFHPNGNWP